MSKTVVLVMPLGNARGGGERMVLHLMQQGRELGIRWHVVFLEDGDLPPQLRELGVGVTVLDAGRMREVHKLLGASAKIAKIAKRERANLILGWMGTGHLYGGPAALLAGLPAAWYQLDVPRNPGGIDRLAARIPARFVLTLSTAGFEAQKALTPKSPVRLVYPGVELERFDPATLPSKTDTRVALGLPPDRPIVGIVGRLQRWKGMHTVIEAMPSVLAKHPDALAVIVGGQHEFEPEYEQHLKDLVVQQGLSNAVRMVGFQRNIPEWVQALDVFVHASDHEPFGIVVIEAMALGKPTIATNTAGPTEIITPEVDGLLTPYGDTGALATELLRVLDDPAFAAGLGTAARARALTFSTKRYAENLVTVLQEFV